MTGAAWAALAVAGLAVLLSAAVLVSVRGLRRSVTRVEAALETEVEGLAVALDELQASLGTLRRQVDRLADANGLPELDAPEPRLSRVPSVLRTRSVVKAMALGTGTAHAARRLRHGTGNGNGGGDTNGKAR